MKNPNKKYGKLILMVLAFVLVMQNVTAQTNPPAPPSFTNNVVDNDAVPINGLVTIALALGAYYGVRKLREN